MDMWAVAQEGVPAISWSFLSISWGIVANVDIGSEKWRHLGALRILLGAIIEIVNLKTYHGFSYPLYPQEKFSIYPLNPKMVKWQIFVHLRCVKCARKV
jgi:hypothetical protein